MQAVFSSDPMQVGEHDTALCKQVFSYMSFANPTRELLELIFSGSVICGHGNFILPQATKAISQAAVEACFESRVV